MANRLEGSRKKTGNGPKGERLLVRIQADEKEAFETAAKLAGIPLSAWVRERLRLMATRELEKVGITPAYHRGLTD